MIRDLSSMLWKAQSRSSYHFESKSTRLAPRWRRRSPRRSDSVGTGWKRSKPASRCVSHPPRSVLTRNFNFAQDVSDAFGGLDAKIAEVGKTAIRIGLSVLNNMGRVH